MPYVFRKHKYILGNIAYFKGYTIIQNDRLVLKSNGQTHSSRGAAILIKRDLAYHNCITMADLYASNGDVELLWVIIRPPLPSLYRFMYGIPRTIFA